MSRGVPLRGAKTQPGFHRGPCRGRKPVGFSSLCEASPRSGRKSSGMAGRIPPCGGCASPSGAQCRRMAVFCLPGTMPDWGEDE
ncbi:MAG: hypothetical protein LBK61_00055 [Spirochaetaceae bacterium]|nr:hypothetical protein [Spirochaetaceae bacterium]